MLRRLIPVCCMLLFVLLPEAKAQEDASELVVRLSEMEQQIRQMSGQIEQLQHENRQLKEQLRSLGVQQPAGSIDGAVPPAPAAETNVPPASPAGPQGGMTGTDPAALSSGPGTTGIGTGNEADAPRRDVFDPSRQPDAPGVPRQLGTTEPSSPLTEAERRQDQAGYRMPNGAIPDQSASPANGSEAMPPRASPPAGPSVAATGTGDPRADYEEAYSQFTKGKYREAEMGFRRFLQSHPRDEQVPEAMYWLGETYLATSQPREAGEQFLALTKQYGSSPKAPSALLKLGTSLVNIGASDRACAIFAEVTRKYPKASQSYRDEVAREQRRANCS